MSAPVPGLAASLAPVRDALHCAALRDAARALVAARDQAQALENGAQRHAMEIIARARDAGTNDARAAIEIERVRMRRKGRATVLRARMGAYRTLRDRTRAAVRALTSDTDYPSLHATLVAAARSRLGPDAEITDAEGGGVFGRLGDRRLDLSLDTMAERAADAVADGLGLP